VFDDLCRDDDDIFKLPWASIGNRLTKGSFPDIETQIAEAMNGITHRQINLGFITKTPHSHPYFHL
jgi:hypothetical protein